MSVTTFRSARVSAALGIALAVLSLSACFGTYTRTVPIVDPALDSKGLVGKEVVLRSETGAVGMRLDSMRYPYIMGNATSHGGLAHVRIDRYDGYTVVSLDDSGRITSRRRLRSPDVLRDPGLLIGNNIQFTSSSGSVVLRDVELMDPPWAEVLYTALGVAAAALLLLLMLASNDLGSE